MFLSLLEALCPSNGKQGDREGRCPLKPVQMGLSGLPQQSQEPHEVLGFLCLRSPRWLGIRLPIPVLQNIHLRAQFRLVSPSFLTEKIITKRVPVRILAGLGLGKAGELCLSGLCECHGLNCGPLKLICWVFSPQYLRIGLYLETAFSEVMKAQWGC